MSRLHIVDSSEGTSFSNFFNFSWGLNLFAGNMNLDDRGAWEKHSFLPGSGNKCLVNGDCKKECCIGWN